MDRYREVPDELSQPAFHPEYLPGGANPTMVPVYEKPFFLKPTLASPAFRRVTAPLLAEFIEDREDDIRPCILCHNGCFNMCHYKGVPNDQDLSRPAST